MGGKHHQLKWGPKAPSLANLLLCLDKVRKVSVENFNIFLSQEKLHHTKASQSAIFPLASPLLSPTWRLYLTSDPVTWYETTVTLHSRTY